MQQDWGREASPVPLSKNANIIREWSSGTKLCKSAKIMRGMLTLCGTPM